jgi:hypothetical protein
MLWIRIRIDPHNFVKPALKKKSKQHKLYVTCPFYFRFDETKEPFRCCGEASCLALSEKVSKLLDKDVLEVQMCHRYASGDDKYQPKPENMRYIAYRNIFFLMYGRTRPKMSRAPLPSCVVMKIRESFPDPQNHYTGFRPNAKKQRTGTL